MHLAAAEIAKRLQAYPFIRTSMSKPKIFKEETLPHEEPFYWAEYFNDDVRASIKPLLKGTYSNFLPLEPAKGGVESASSPVLITGDSFVDSFYPKSAGLIGKTASLINQPVTVQRIAGNLVNGFQEMFRDPTILAGKKVVIWVIDDEPVGYDSQSARISLRSSRFPRFPKRRPASAFGS